LPNLSLNLSEAAAMYPDRAAIRLDDVVLTYAELDDLSARLATLLRSRGLQVGDRVGVMMPNVPEFAIGYYGVLRAGGVVVPMNPLLKAREVAYYLGDSGARHIFAWHEVAAAAAEGAASAGAQLQPVNPGEFAELLGGFTPSPEVVSRALSDTAIILYTSGTTGKPKGAELTHTNLSRNAAVTASTLLNLGVEDVIMGCLPFFHAFGQTCCLNAAVANGSTLTLLARFDARKAMEVIARDQVTVFEGVPTMYSALLEQVRRAPTDVSSLRVCISGGAALPVEVLGAFEAAFGCILLEGYGLSETSPVASFNHPGGERKAGSIGTPIDGVEFRLIDDEGAEVVAGGTGEIAIRGHNVMKGYWRRPDETAAAFHEGWFKTGDVGRVDDDGFYYIVDRKKDLIISGGFNVFPREIEDVLGEHPAVAMSVVLGVPDDHWGEAVKAVVVARPGASIEPAELIALVKERKGPVYAPKSIDVVDALPLTGLGKPDRKALRARYWQGTDRAVN
jgi:long-chain acyl-CoA synthetase